MPLELWSVFDACWAKILVKLQRLFTHGAGVYEWESRAAADSFYNDAWRERLRTIYGAVPQIEFFDLHAVVDNDAGTARIDAAS
ncbi:MAG: Monooxygenase [Pseudomonadota bacterium]|nr:Monooxygenase [Pseudomonadota bacterium]